MSHPLLNAVERHPEESAFTDGSLQLTYRELWDHVALPRGLKSAAHVAWCPKGDFESFVHFWRLQMAGCVACPISERFPDETRRAITNQLDALWLPAGSDLVGLPTATTPSQRGGVAFDKPATIILSSGSTGTPKAIVHSLAAHVASARGAAATIPLAPGDRWLWSLPMYHVSGLSILFRCAAAAATVVALERGETVNADRLRELHITHVSVVNTQLQRLMMSDSFPGPNLKSVLLGGSAVQPSLVQAARERGVAVHTTYGLTEMASQVTTSTPSGDPSSSGSVLPGRQLMVDDQGEILVRGETLCLGYFRAGSLVSVVDNQGWFHTGDRGSLEDGNLMVSGRIDNMFVSGGENIYPEVIERELLKFPQVRQAIVVPRPHEDFGSRPVAFVQGDLDAGWEETLRRSLCGFEIPDAILPWPNDAELSIKPDRKKMKTLVTPD